MCIRDSLEAERLVEGDRPVNVADAVAGVDQLGHGSERIPCLLYTSDAADDLLCVDLGGRRINKKNNT